MTLNLNNLDTFLVFDQDYGPYFEDEIESDDLDGCEFSGSNIGFDIQMNRRRLILLGSESRRATLQGIETEQSTSAEN